MAFVFPILLGGLALIGLPVLIHLILRQKPKTLPFPAFRFLLQRHKTNLRKLRLRHLFILALRILIIGAICLALTRPRLVNQSLGLSRDRPVVAALLFDTSYSMEYKTGEGITRLEEAKKRGHEALNELPEGSRVAILDTGEGLVATRGDGLLSVGQARERINNLKLKYANGPVSKRLSQAYRLLAEVSRSREEGNLSQWPRALFIFSDRTRGSWESADRDTIWEAADFAAPSYEGLQQARSDIPLALDLLKDLRSRYPPPAGRDYPDQSLREALEELRNRLPGLTRDYLPPEPNLEKIVNDARRRTRGLLALAPPSTAEDPYPGKLRAVLQNLERDFAGVQAFWVDVGIDQPVDLAISQIEFPTLPNGQPKQLFAADDIIVLRVVVQATGKDASTDLICQIGDSPLRQTVDVKAGHSATVSFEIDAGSLKLAPGAHQVEIRLGTNDLLPFNNQRFATFAIREPRKILILTDQKDETPALLVALQTVGKRFNFSPVLKNSAELSRLNLRDFIGIFLLGLREPDDNAWETLRRYVEGGGGLAVIPGGHDMKPAAYLQETARKLLPGAYGKVIVEKEGAPWDFADASIYQHPFMQPFKDWKDFDLIKNPRSAFSFWEVKPLEHQGEVLVYYGADPKSIEREPRPALLERRFINSKGKVLMFTTPFQPQNPPWNDYISDLNSFFLVVTGQTARYLAGDAETPRHNFITGREPPRLSLRGSDLFSAFTLRGPEQLEKVLAPEPGGQLVFPQATLPGNYLVESAGGEVVQRLGGFSVNMPAEESDLARVPAEELESVLGQGAVVPVDRKANLKDSLAGNWLEPVELFSVLMAALLVILAVENLVSNKFYRRET